MPITDAGGGVLSRVVSIFETIFTPLLENRRMPVQGNVGVISTETVNVQLIAKTGM
jgi:hypothetical protein